MSQIENDDLEEGEILDEEVSEPVVEKKCKVLPRRYNLNDGKVSKHKKNCKHASEHCKHKSNNVHKNSKLHKKHRKACPKHDISNYSKFLGKKSNLFFENTSNSGRHGKGSPYNHSKLSLSKSAFKNFMSPPRKVFKVENFHSKVQQYPESLSFSKKLLEHNKSKEEINNVIDVIDLVDDENSLSSKISNEEGTVSPAQEICEFELVEESKMSSDDEDVEELRRLALATCAKRPPDEPEITENISKTSLNSLLVTSDNYDVVDMEMGNSDSENLETENDLYVIDTTPTYFNESNQPLDTFDVNLTGSNNAFSEANAELQNQCFPPNIQNFTSDALCQELNDDLYSNFETVVEKSSVHSNQLDEEFEEELLRAELIANMKSVRQKSTNDIIKKENIPLDNSIDAEMEKPKIKNISIEAKALDLKTDMDEMGHVFNERTVNITNVNSNRETNFKEERTVSIINNAMKTVSTLHDKARSVTAIFSNANPVRKGVDIKVKLNNVSSNNVTSNKIIQPQERIIISLNNESSSDESDQEEDIVKEPANKIPAVASLEALITNARHESDGKKESASNSNNSSDAVSWLSKAQQEEYNSLKKILDAKKQLPLSKISQNKVTNVVENSELALLKKKLIIAKKNLDKEKETMNTTMKEVVKKKRAYVASKLKCQELKEQLLTAEKVRRTNLELWTKCSSNLQTSKKSVSKREAMIKSLQTKLDALFVDFCPVNISLPSHEVDHNYNICL